MVYLYDDIITCILPFIDEYEEKRLRVNHSLHILMQANNPIIHYVLGNFEGLEFYLHNQVLDEYNDDVLPHTDRNYMDCMDEIEDTVPGEREYCDCVCRNFRYCIEELEDIFDSDDYWNHQYERECEYI